MSTINVATIDGSACTAVVTSNNVIVGASNIDSTQWGAASHTHTITTGDTWNNYGGYRGGSFTPQYPYDWTPSWPNTIIGPGLYPQKEEVDYEKIRKSMEELFNKEKKEEVPMKNLYSVIMVTEAEEIVLDKKVIAETDKEAEFLAGVAETLKEKSLKFSQVTVLTSQLGRVKVKKEEKK